VQDHSICMACRKASSAHTTALSPCPITMQHLTLITEGALTRQDLLLLYQSKPHLHARFFVIKVLQQPGADKCPPASEACCKTT